MAKMEVSLKKCITPKARVSFPKVFKPASFKNGPLKYSCVFLFQKDTDLKELKRAANNAAIEKFGKDKAKWPKKLKMPFRDGDEDKAGKAEYENTIFVSASCKDRPQVIDAKKQPITEEDQTFYAGCFARASMIAFYYNEAGNEGISFALQNIQKLEDGEKLSGRRNASEEFDEYESEDSDSDDESNYEDDEDLSDIEF